MASAVFKKTVTAIFLLAAFCVLISLGLWQKDRLAWKESILSDIAAFETIIPDKTPLSLSQNYDGVRFRRGRIEGRFITPLNPVLIGPRTHKGQSGYHVLFPFETTSNTVIIVNRGWIPAEMKDNLPRLSDSSWIAGHLREASRSSITPTNKPQAGLWYWPDIDALADFYNIDVYPALFYLESAQNMPDIYPIAFDGLPRPRNKHAQYMIFWFGMAGLLVVLCGLTLIRNHSHRQI